MWDSSPIGTTTESTLLVNDVQVWADSPLQNGHWAFQFSNYAALLSTLISRQHSSSSRHVTQTTGDLLKQKNKWQGLSDSVTFKVGSEKESTQVLPPPPTHILPVTISSLPAFSHSHHYSVFWLIPHSLVFHLNAGSSAMVEHMVVFSPSTNAPSGRTYIFIT